jgi:large subunit ribosomal protein L25
VREITLNATIRTALGRSANNSRRREGYVPGIFYMRNDKNIPIEVKLLDLRHLVYTAETHIVDLQLSDGTNEKCVVRDLQFDPVTDRVIHFDLLGLVMTEKMRVEVPIMLIGSAIGLKSGGVLNHLLYKVEVECLPGDLPEHIELDITNMNVGDVLTVSELRVENAVIHSEPDIPVVTIAHSRHEEASAIQTQEVPAEPEVIGKGKTEDEE